MVTRINGAPRQGVWFSADVRFVSVTVTGSTTFLSDLTVTSTDPRQADVVNSDLEQVAEILSTRGTVIGLTVESDLIAHFMVDYAQAYDPDNVVLGGQAAQDVNAEVDAAIVAIGATVTSVVVATLAGFEGLAQGTPA
jgi:hypothetical protein